MSGITRPDWEGPEVPEPGPGKEQSITRPDWTDGVVSEPAPVKEQSIVRPDWDDAPVEGRSLEVSNADDEPLVAEPEPLVAEEACCHKVGAVCPSSCAAWIRSSMSDRSSVCHAPMPANNLLTESLG